MSEQKLLFLDIEAKQNGSAPAERPLWARTDNSFRFNFLSDSHPAPQDATSQSSTIINEAAESQISSTRPGSAFAFNFQIPLVNPEESMDTSETPETFVSVQEEKPTLLKGVNDNPPEEAVQSKAKKKKKKKSEKKKPSESTEPRDSPSLAEGSERGEDTELSTEEQLNRQLDWCIEQLEVGMRSQKATPKQKEDASRALKTLRSSKAPLAKKRQVMRAMTGDYRKKMEEEKSKQYKLIQNEMASAKVKVVSDSPKKCVFHRRVEAKSRDAELPARTEEQTSSTFVFTPSNEEFRFNFL